MVWLFHANTTVWSVVNPANHPSVLSCCNQPNPAWFKGKLPVFSVCMVAVLNRTTWLPVRMYAMRGWLARFEKVKHRSRAGCTVSRR